MNLLSFIKKLIIFDVIWGTRSKKLAGINDKNNVISDNVIFSSSDNSITLTSIPSWFQKDKYFRITTGGGNNLNQLYKIISIDNLNNKIIVSGLITDFTGNTTLDGRIAVVINDINIAKLDSSGSTIFNLDNQSWTGFPDGSGIAQIFANHYHGSQSTPNTDFNAILTHEFGISGHLLYGWDNILNLHIPLGPLVVVDNNGNVVVSGDK